MAWKIIQIYNSTILASGSIRLLYFSTNTKICWKPNDIQGTLVFDWPGALVWPWCGLVMRWALRVAPSSGNLQTTEVHLVLPPLEGLAPVTAAQLGFNGTDFFLLIEMRGFHHKGI